MLKTVYKAVADSLKKWNRCLIIFKSTVNWEKTLSHANWPFFFPPSDFSNGGDGMLATSSNGSQYSGSRVETPVSYVGDDDDDDDDFNENDDDD